MSDTNTAKAATAQTQEKAYSLADVERVYFAPSQLGSDAARETFAKITALDAPMRSNFDMNAEMPEGYGIFIIPISQRQNGETQNTGIALFAVPDMDAVALKSEAGMNFIRASYMSALAVKIANSVRPRKDGSTAASIPYAQEDFFESMRGSGESLKTFNTLAPDVVKTLRARGLSRITAPQLRSVLQSKTFAEATFPKVDQAVWVKLLVLMINIANQKNLSTDLLVNWQRTRDEATPDEETLDLSALDGLMG